VAISHWLSQHKFNLETTKPSKGNRRNCSFGRDNRTRYFQVAGLALDGKGLSFLPDDQYNHGGGDHGPDDDRKFGLSPIAQSEIAEFRCLGRLRCPCRSRRHGSFAGIDMRAAALHIEQHQSLVDRPLFPGDAGTVPGLIDL
jgi:hypothetical protein